MPPTVAGTSIVVGGASHVAENGFQVQSVLHLRFRYTSEPHPAEVTSVAPGEHEFVGWPLHVPVVQAHTVEQVRMRVPQFPHGSFTMVPGTHPPTSSFSHGE
jgi:hypothetical protein